jgi:hypothetical protein
MFDMCRASHAAPLLSQVAGVTMSAHGNKETLCCFCGTRVAPDEKAGIQDPKEFRIFSMAAVSDSAHKNCIRDRRKILKKKSEGPLSVALLAVEATGGRMSRSQAHVLQSLAPQSTRPRPSELDSLGPSVLPHGGGEH